MSQSIVNVCMDPVLRVNRVYVYAIKSFNVWDKITHVHVPEIFFKVPLVHLIAYMHKLVSYSIQRVPISKQIWAMLRLPLCSEDYPVFF